VTFLIALHDYDNDRFPFIFPSWLIIPITVTNTVVPVIATNAASWFAFFKEDFDVNQLKKTELELLEEAAKEDLKIARQLREVATLGTDHPDATATEADMGALDNVYDVKNIQKAIGKMTLCKGK
jgi:hypothetical protein